MSRRKTQRSRVPAVFLDEVDVIQMADAALEWGRETYGLLHGVVTRRHGRDEFRIAYVQVLQGGQRKRREVGYSDRSHQRLLRRYRDIIGDFHSHIGELETDHPSHDDIHDILQSYPDGRGIFILLHVTREARKTDEDGRNQLIRRRDRIVYRSGDAVVTLHFYALRPWVRARRKNARARDHVWRVSPRCRIRYKINQEHVRIT